MTNTESLQGPTVATKFPILMQPKDGISQQGKNQHQDRLKFIGRSLRRINCLIVSKTLFLGHHQWSLYFISNYVLDSGITSPLIVIYIIC